MQRDDHSQRRWPIGTIAKVGLILVAAVVWFVSRSSAPHSTASGVQYGTGAVGEFHCVPKNPGPHPAVIMLHGAAMRGVDSDQFHAMCAMLAEHGYYAEFLEYYDATENQDPSIDEEETFAAWFAAIHAGIDALDRNPAVDPKRIAVMGFSQGAYLATGCGAMFPAQVAAVVEYYGGLFPQLKGRAKLMPPTLILHGARDSIIPVSEATELDQLLTASGRPHEIHIYPQAEHAFNFHGSGARYSQDDADDAWNRTLKFLDHTFR